MKKYILLLPIRRKLSVIVFLMYAIIDALIIEENIGIVSVFVLGFFYLINYNDKRSYKIYFSISLILLVLAVILYVLDVTYILEIPISKLSEWSFVLLSLGAVQLFLSSRMHHD